MGGEEETAAIGLEAGSGDVQEDFGGLWVEPGRLTTKQPHVPLLQYHCLKHHGLALGMWERV
jgi:hypothetical protein